MSDQKKHIEDLNKKLDLLISKQDLINKGIESVQDEINELAFNLKTESPIKKETSLEIKADIESDQSIADYRDKHVSNEKSNKADVKNHSAPDNKVLEPAKKTQTPKKRLLDNEAFMGANLLNKIGIIIIIIGVSIGAKYAIDNNLISPVTRIFLAYLVGVVLMFIAYRLTKTMKNYSMVLLSGSFAIFYFVTYVAYSFYDMFPQSLTFVLMASFTVFTTLSALYYNRQVIAHIGLVGAYAVPFLLSSGSGQFEILFSYIAIINIGIVFLIKYKDWKALVINSFAFTWITYISWNLFKYKSATDFELALLFLTLFFVIFLVMLVYHFRDSALQKHIVLVFSNAFIFFGFGYMMIDKEFNSISTNATFTFINSLIYLVPIYIMMKKKELKLEFFYVMIGISTIFFTMTISVLFDAKTVTSLWAIEAAALFYLGRAKGIDMFEKSANVLILLTLGSLIEDWFYTYFDTRNLDLTFIFNEMFLTSILVFAAYLFIFKTDKKHAANKIYPIVEKLKYVLLFTSFFSILLEINHFWQILYFESRDVELTYIRNHNYMSLNALSLSLYFTVYFTVIFKFFSRHFEQIKDKVKLYNLSFIILYLLLIFNAGFHQELFSAYLNGTRAEYFGERFIDTFFQYFSYISIAFLFYELINFGKNFEIANYKTTTKIFGNIGILFFLTIQLTFYLQVLNVTDSWKLYVTILWGLYALSMVFYGLKNDSEMIRKIAISIVFISVAKLFFYDISHLTTIKKTIVFVILGSILLLISYLYNKLLNEEKSKVDKVKVDSKTE